MQGNDENITSGRGGRGFLIVKDTDAVAKVVGVILTAITVESEEILLADARHQEEGPVGSIIK